MVTHTAVINLKITHRPGVRNQNAGALSRLPYSNAETNEKSPKDTEDDSEIIAVIATIYQRMQISKLQTHMPMIGLAPRL